MHPGVFIAPPLTPERATFPTPILCHLLFDCDSVVDILVAEADFAVEGAHRLRGFPQTVPAHHQQAMVGCKLDVTRAPHHADPATRRRKVHRMDDDLSPLSGDPAAHRLVYRPVEFLRV